MYCRRRNCPPAEKRGRPEKSVSAGRTRQRRKASERPRMIVLMVLGTGSSVGVGHRAMEPIAKGIESAGGRIERLVLSHLRIERCRYCPELLAPCRREGDCGIEDDFHAVVERMRTADAVVFGCPACIGGLTPVFEAFFHRLVQLCRGEPGRRGLAGKAVAGVCVGGGADLSARTMTDLLAACGFAVREVVSVTRRNLPVATKALHDAGRGLVGAPPQPIDHENLRRTG